MDDATVADLCERLGTTSDVILDEQRLGFEGIMMKLEEMQTAGAANTIANLSLRALWRKYCGPVDSVHVSTFFDAIHKYFTDDLRYNAEQLAMSLWTADMQAAVLDMVDTDRNKIVRVCACARCCAAALRDASRKWC